MQSFPRRYFWLVGVLLIAGCTTPAAPSARPLMVAVGDSFSAGGEISPATPCARSDASWVKVLANDYEYRFNNQACSGAKVSDVYTQMLHASDASVIALTIGGNDFGWLELMRACIVGDCTPDVAAATTPTKLQNLHLQVAAVLRAAAQNLATNGGRTVILSAYPEVVGQGTAAGCNLFSPSDRVAMSSAVEVLNATLAASVQEVKSEGFAVYFVVQHQFVDHGACAADPWVRTPVESTPFHPTVEGYRRMASAVKVLGL